MRKELYWLNDAEWKRTGLLMPRRITGMRRRHRRWDQFSEVLDAASE